MVDAKSWLRLPHIVLAGYWLALFTATHMPMTRIKSDVTLNDKVVHLGAYTILAFLVALVVFTGRATIYRYTFAGLAVFAYALLDETLQMLVPSRHVDVWDAVANVCGAVLGFSFCAGASFVALVIGRRRSELLSIDAVEPVDGCS